MKFSTAVIAAVMSVGLSATAFAQGASSMLQYNASGPSPAPYSGGSVPAQADVSGNQLVNCIVGCAAPVVNLAPAVTNTAAAYAAGNVMGGLITLTGAARTSAGSGLIQSVLATFDSGIVPAVDVVFFNASPSTSTTANNTVLAISAADLPKVIGVVHISDCTLGAATTMSICQAQTQAVPFKLPTGTALYAVFVTRTAVTLTTTTDLGVMVSVIQN